MSDSLQKLKIKISEQLPEGTMVFISGVINPDDVQNMSGEELLKKYDKQIIVLRGVKIKESESE